MTGRKRQFITVSAVLFAAVMMLSVVATPVAADAAVKSDFSPEDLTVGTSSTTQDLAGGSSNLKFETDSSGKKASIIIDLSPITNAGGDISSVSVGSTTAGSGSIDSTTVDVSNSQIEIAATGDNTGDGVIDITEFKLTGIDTSNLNLGGTLKYNVRIDNGNAGNFATSLFTATHSTQTSDFTTGFVEVTTGGSQVSTHTTIANALDQIPNNANDFTVRAARQQYTLDEGDYTIASNPTSITIEPANIDSGNLTIKDSANDGADGEMFGAGSETKLTIKDAVIDASVDDQVFNLEASGFDDLTLFNTTVDDAGNGGSKDVITVADASGVDSVNLTDSKFIAGGNNQVLLDTLGNGVDADVIAVNNTFSGYDTVINAENDETFTNVDISDNTFKNNNVHIDDDNDNLGLNSIFQNSNNDFNKYAVSLNNNDKVGLAASSTKAIYGDASQVTAADAVSTNDATLELGPGTHTGLSKITVNNKRFELRGEESVPTDQVNLTVGNNIIEVDSDAGTGGEGAVSPKVTGITFESIGANGPVVTDNGDNGNVIQPNITDNQFLGSTGNVIDFSQSVTDAVIEANTFDNSGGGAYGVLDIDTSYSSKGSNTGLTLRDNFVANSSDNGAELFELGTVGASQSVSIVNNNISVSGTSNDIFDIDTSDNSATVRFVSNDIDGDGQTALALNDIDEDGDNVQIKGNTITNAGTALDVTTDLKAATISSNTFNANNVQIAAGTISEYGASTLVSDNTFNQLAITTADDNGFQSALDNDNVKDNDLYGAVKNALETVGADGDTVFVAAGDYTESAPTIQNNDHKLVSLSGSDSTTIKYTSAGEFLNVNHNIDFDMEGFTLNTTDTTADNDIAVDSVSANVEINNTKLIGAGTSNPIAIDVQDAGSVTTRNVTTDTYDVGVQVADSANHVFNSTTVNNTGTAAVDIDQNSAEFNDLTVTNAGAKGIHAGTNNDITIRDSTIAASSEAVFNLGDNALLRNVSATAGSETKAVVISGSSAEFQDVNVTAGSESTAIDASGNGAFINNTDINGDDVGIDVGGNNVLIGNSTITATGDALLANGFGVIVDGTGFVMEDNVVENSTVGVRVEDNSGTPKIVRNQIVNNDRVGVDVIARPNGDDNEVTVNFNDIVNNGVAIELGDTGDIDHAFANFYGDASGPSGTLRANDPAGGNQDITLSGSGDEIRAGGTAGGDDVNFDEFTPFLTESFTQLPQDDKFVVVTDSRNIFRSSDSPNLPDDNEAEVVVAVLNDTLATQTEAQNIGALGELDEVGTRTPNDATTPNAANPVKFTFDKDEIGTFDITATQTSGNEIEDTTAQQAIIAGANGVNITSESSTVIADGSTKTNITAQLTDGSGNAVRQSGKTVQFDIRANQSNAGASLNTSSATTDVSGQATVTLTADTAGFDIPVRAIAVNSQDRVTITVQEAGTESASVTFNDQSVQNGTEEVTVDSANFTRADGSAGDYVVVVHVVNDTEFDGGLDSSISAPVGASRNLSNGAESITVDLNSSAAFEDGDALDTLSENVTLRAMLHTTANDSAFGTRLGNAIDGIEPGDETDDADITVTPASPLDGPAAEFDADADGDISITELGDAGQAFLDDELTIQELGEIGQEFLS